MTAVLRVVVAVLAAAPALRAPVALSRDDAVAASSPADKVDVSALGGPGTVDADGPGAFSLPAPPLDRDQRRAFSVGNSLFRNNWVIAPASPSGRDGLGPLFNATSCSGCHQEDGRGRPPRDEHDVGTGMVVFVSPADLDGQPHPVYGSQIQDQAIPGVAPEARIRLEPIELPGQHADGSAYTLRRWDVRFLEPGHGPLGPVRASPRLGQQLIGMGLLEAVADETIVALEDPTDRDGDGISGRAHRIPSADGAKRIGRFGWKASQPTIEDQVAAALHGDIGITSPGHPEESLTPRQRADLGQTPPTGAEADSPEIDDARLGRIAHYCRVLAVPRQRRASDLVVGQGRRLFSSIGCAACHRPELTTGHASPVEAFHDVVIRPYTDLLLHDMGDGLADHRRDGDASGSEWRTPPLWGIGLLETVGGAAHFLHDGRARTLEEAILWHGGEAQASRDAFSALSAQERAAVIAFLESL